MPVRNLTRGTFVADAVEVATGFWGTFRGLMGRAALPAGAGLWLPGTRSIHMMFMRFAIDCLFLGPASEDGSRTVRSVRRGLPPWRGVVWYVRGADGVIELPAGTLERSGTQVGDQIAF